LSIRIILSLLLSMGLAMSSVHADDFSDEAFEMEEGMGQANEMMPEEEMAPPKPAERKVEKKKLRAEKKADKQKKVAAKKTKDKKKMHKSKKPNKKQKKTGKG